MRHITFGIVGLILAMATATMARADSAVTTIDGVGWRCGQTSTHGPNYYDCTSTQGELYESALPITKETLAEYRKEWRVRDEETACYCSKQIEEGVASPYGFLCTGYYAPGLLRERKVDPCAGAWESRK